MGYVLVYVLGLASGIVVSFVLAFVWDAWDRRRIRDEIDDRHRSDLGVTL